MNITSIFKGTVNQLTTGAGKVISNVVDFFSSLRSGITGLFNSSTPFRQATTEPSFIHHNDPKKTSLGNLKDFLNEKCGMNTTEDQVNGEIDNIGNDIYEERNIYEEMNNKEDPIYEEINENILDLIRKLPESRNENKSSVIEDEYSIVVDSIEESSENIYSEPYEAALSDGNKYNTI